MVKLRKGGRSHKVPVNFNCQLLYYLTLLLIIVASIPVPTYKRRISIEIGNAFSSLNNGIFFANIWYPSADDIKDSVMSP